MFKFSNLFSNSENYPETIQKIHQDFDSITLKALQEARQILDSESQKDIEKGKRLAKLGFTSTKEAVESKNTLEKITDHENKVKNIQKYQDRYPLHKYITKAECKLVLEKYNLYIGDISRFIGFVPEKNLKEIENFKPTDFDKKRFIEFWAFRDIEVDEDEYTEYARNEELRGYSHSRYNYGGDKQFQICAPYNQFDLDKSEVKGRSIVNADPIVMYPVNGGYIIVSAWGDEASDPIIVNEKNN